MPCTFQHRGQFTGAPALVIQKRGKDARTVKPRPAQEVDCAVEADQGGSSKIADDPVIFDRLSHALPVWLKDRNSPGPGRSSGVTNLPMPRFDDPIAPTTLA